MSSSIFSSECLRAWWRLATREKLRHLLVALLFGLVLVAAHRLAAGVEAALLPYSSAAPFALAHDALSASTEVIFAGSSHLLLGVRPDRFSFEAVNVTGPGWDYRTLEAAVRRNLERAPNLKLAVIELDLFPMRIDTSTVQRGQCSALRVWGIPEEDVPCLDRDGGQGRLASLAAALVPEPRLTPWAIWETVEPRFTGPVENREPIAGHRSFSSVGDPTAHGPRRIEWLASRFGARYVERNREALERLTALLLERGLRVALLRLPHQPSFSDNVPEPWRRQVEHTVQRLRRRAGREIPVWDLDSAPELGPQDFMDSVHLNSSGVRKLGALLEARVRAELLE